MNNEKSLSKEQQNGLRDKYSERIKRLILGPGSENINDDVEHEIISENPKIRYVTGILYPEKALQHNDSVDTAEVEQSGDPIEDPIAVDNNFKASSMGFTFYCKADVGKIEAVIKTAKYNKIAKPFINVSDNLFDSLKGLDNVPFLEFKDINHSISLSGEDDNSIKKSRDNLIKYLETNNPKNSQESIMIFLTHIKELFFSHAFFQRDPCTFTVSLDISQDGSNKKTVLYDFDTKRQNCLEVFDKVQTLRTKSFGNVLAVTIVIKNLMPNPLFQSSIQVKKQTGMQFYASEDVKLPDLSKLQKEDAMNVFMYRNNKTFASGHGVSACWDFEKGRVASVYTTYIPTFEITPTDTENKEIDKNILNPANYIGDDHSKQLAYLMKFIEQYEQWIDKTEKSTTNLSDDFRPLAGENIEKCRECVERMLETLNFLKKNDQAFKAFNIANETMLLQRMTDYSQKAQAYKTKDYSDVHFIFRPFQLAFILNSLESVMNPESKNRNNLDLIWVPTGGGKTEAYLFAIATTIAYRRLIHKKNYDGVTVIMRYTLRLLTSQQFERASKMICALEYIRKNRDDLGKTQVSIGLWIGEGTLNKLKDAKNTFNKMCNSDQLDEAIKKNKFQLLVCPWCGEEHSIIPDEKHFKDPYNWGYWPLSVPKPKYNIRCVNKNCPFHEGLPVFVVDQSIYQIRPTLVFGTVDKFAQIPLNEQAQNLFGSDNPEKYGRPDLVVQDELHLISGPLGSIVGLYEAGFDYIFHDRLTGQGCGPKYIASTATIRNAAEQVRGIFDREVQLFPPRGITDSDNFFVRDSKGKHGRKYFGIMGTGKSQMTVEVHMIAAMLQCAVSLGDDKRSEELFWTVACYFNSLRELGKASSLIRDDVRDYLGQLKKRLDISDQNFRNLPDDNAKELTSRITGNEIPNIMKRLSVAHDSDSPHDKHGLEAVDTLLATKMLSVGIDIGRLNTMLVIGQPKLTAEYIQATSRVGRSSLGAVFALYNSTRSRDRSHYETFQAYHQNLYKFVEPSSVTPFSIPAMKKGIPGVIVAMLRNTVERLSGDGSPQNILDKSIASQLQQVKKYLLQRVADSEGKYQLYGKDAKKIIDSCIDNWMRLAQKDVADEKQPEYQQFLYYKYLMSSDQYGGNLLLKSFNDKSHHSESMKVMGSMREVEDVSYVDIKGDVENGI
ncbi:helicase protein [Lentilactobacillus parafarraginis F0439]|uniref:Helicase protein n=1 Tax=Lentilactobacillus parafarraginis F0439 TaxID=797515 RepID=G9ZT68_9LACO|nr:helicase-related protein [Lentilactobacillus parafarraginis]EHL95524.1 helicase protein [Lentilactobacillus parafarraginis F0439]